MSKENIKIKCTDGFELTGTIYKPVAALKGAIMICPATGIKRRFYNSFATHLADNNYGVICFDNRGIGDSAGADINKVDATLINWGQLDMSAVFESLKLQFPNQKYHLIGHSAGGQLVGLMSNAKELSSIFNFASSSGSLKNMKYPFKAKATFYLNMFIPVSNFLFGVTHSQWVGMGEPLPKAVASQWSKWCNGAGYVATDFGSEIKEHLYDELNFPSMWLYATDDVIANYENVKEMADVFSKSKVEFSALDPKALGKKQIGHMGFFSSKNKDLWPRALDWLANN